MAGRRTWAAFLTLGLLVCAGAVGIIATRLQGHADRRRDGATELPRRRAEPAGPPRSTPREDAPEPPPPLPEAPAEPLPEPVAPPDPSEPAVITLELLVPAAEPERRVLVQVIDAFGDPVPEALIVFRKGSLILYRERTDGDGEAAFQPLAEERGPFRVDALAHGFLPGAVAETRPGTTTEIILTAAPIVEGEVRAPSRGHGLVRLFTGRKVLETEIRNDGTFAFEDLEEGVVTVQAEVEPYGIAEETFFLQAGLRRFVILRVRPDSRVQIYGEIRRWPAAGSASINGVAVPVSHNGLYEFDQAVVGTNEIFVDAPGKALMRERFSVAGRAKSKYNFTLAPEAEIKGRVRDERTRASIEGAEVRVGVEFGDPRNDRVPLFPVERVPVVRTDRDGRFTIRRLDLRLLYLVSVVAPGYGQELLGAVPDGGRLLVDMPDGPFLFGRLQGLGGVPADAVVTAVRLQERPESRVFNVADYDGARSVRDAKGFYGLSGLLPDAYLVRVDAAEFGSVETVVDLAEEGRGPSGGRRVRLDFRLRRGAHLEQEDAELLQRLPPAVTVDPDELPPSETTSLRIDAERPPDATPFNGVRVLFFEGELEFTAPLDFTELSFELLGLPEGAYRAVLQHSTLRKPVVREDITLRRGVPVTVTLR